MMRRRLEAVQRSGGENWGNNNWEECSTEHWRLSSSYNVICTDQYLCCCPESSFRNTNLRNMEDPLWELVKNAAFARAARVAALKQEKVEIFNKQNFWKGDLRERIRKSCQYVTHFESELLSLHTHTSIKGSVDPSLVKLDKLNNVFFSSNQMQLHMSQYIHVLQMCY